MTAIVTTPPAAEPVSVEEARQHLRLTSTAEDGLIARLIRAARAHVESVTRRALITQGWRYYLDDWPPGRVIYLPVAPVASVESVLVFAGDGAPVAVEETALRLDGASGAPRLKVAAGAPGPLDGFNGIEVDFTAGYGADASAVPPVLVQAVLLLTAHWFEHRELGVETAMAAVPAGLDALLGRYRSLRL
ncbi:head-tail connector protein [Stappia indica]|uniref:head-tail connector protein n=1 Tax=Stappia indica TaxID=538381 RepID=UPI001CD3A19A|nr:head-tail connector protein [Stappia indica]MCA1300710.1 head-tail connector protein [Stappia indica]